ncbi:hypothetical protein P3T18_006303 [Paraburkholderia sp. GAS199]|uniref:DUF4148 domain-containing protein n=1 Tax=Paraburkholderia sp. GAS199 TaxID=3035126 RepID=UPI003D1AFC0C
MKVSMIALTLAACVASASSFAGNAVDTNVAVDGTPRVSQPLPIQTAQKVKTRAEVRQELVRAEKDGQLAALNKLYQGS